MNVPKENVKAKMKKRYNDLTTYDKQMYIDKTNKCRKGQNMGDACLDTDKVSCGSEDCHHAFYFSTTNIVRNKPNERPKIEWAYFQTPLYLNVRLTNSLVFWMLTHMQKLLEN
ncbi:disease resistance protein [Striga asiatica]|uniref:Disease resistance protein n=1 Tax=Striga asiatica TaxID=4170 RepID=A0A5A7RAG0_STRAF|nr:disease resistance protein [Striga asiatica]